MASNHLVYKGYTGSVEIDIEDACIHGKILFIDDIITYEGETLAEIRAAFEQAVDRYLAYCEKIGKAANKPYSGSFNVRVGPDLHRRASQAAFLKGITLNQYVSRALENTLAGC